MNIIASNGVMSVGHQLDNLATVISFPIKAVVADQGSGGTWTVRIQRNGDVAAYPTSNFSVGDEYLNLILTASDLAVVGEGQIQIKYTIGSKILMSRVYKFYSHFSLDASASTPEPWVSWADEVEANADRAEEAVEHYPYINSTNKHWMTWDADSEEFVDTGVKAEGSIGAVDSVNGQTGTVVLDAEDVGALPSSTTIPTKTSDLTNDSGFLTEHQSLSNYYTKTETDTLVDAKSAVSVSSTGTATDTVSYITIDGTEKKLAGGSSGTTDFEELDNRPKYNGSVMTGDTNIPEVPSTIITKISAGTGINTDTISGQATIALSSETQTSLAKADTALQSVPNTYRTSAAQDTIDNTKVDKVSGKGLSTNDYDNTEKASVASAVSHIASTSNPHSVTASQIGLGNVNNTSDANKPISTATQAALDAKSTVSASSTGTSTTTANYITIDNTEYKLAGGVDDYDDLSNRPQIAGVTLTGNKTLANLGLRSSSAQDAIDATKADIVKQTSISLTTAGWSSSSPYSQEITSQISGADANTKVDLQADNSLLTQLINDGVSAMYVTNNSGTLTCYAVGGKPSVALAVQATYYEVD